MELRELSYFLAVAREQSISRAAEVLFVTQPNLSRQMQKLERELGQPLFLRGSGSRKLVLTEAGRLLQKRAEELLDLYQKTERELRTPSDELEGEVSIGCGESYVMKLVAQAARDVQKRHPGVRVSFFSGDGASVAERLDKGLIDFGIFIEPADISKYDCLQLPLTDTWGVLMRRDAPLACRERITPEDLWDLPLICSKQSFGKPMISQWFRKKPEQLRVVATYNLIYNASLLVEAGLGYAVGLDKLINTSGNSELCFRPLYPSLESHLDIAWKKHQVFSGCAEVFLEQLREYL